MNIKVDAELKALIQPLAPEELAQLEANILENGCRDPLVIWNETIVDGHNRFDICQRHNIQFQTVFMDFSDMESAKVWMLRNQIGRRNLNDFQRSEIALQLEDLLKAQAKERQGTRTDLESVHDLVQNSAQCSVAEECESDLEPVHDLVQNSAQCSSRKTKTRDTVAKTAGVSHDTIKKVKSIKSAAIPEVQDLARSGAVSIHAAAQIADMPAETQAAITEEIHDGAKPSTAIKKHVHVAQNSGENEWYTPADIIEAARAAMGSIDCDPASSEIANATVKAAKYFTKEDNGLQQQWHGNVWMNPPYAQPLMSLFADAITAKFADGEIRQACILVNNATETKWFQTLLGSASAVCFPRSRIRFLSPDGKKGAPLQGQAIIYIGDDTRAFADAFAAFGAILPR